MNKWKEKGNPQRLERRYTFVDYEALRSFLESAAIISESVGYFPDMAFGRDYLNVTITPYEGEMLAELHYQLTVDLDALGGYAS